MGCYNMSSIDHLHVEADKLKVKEHLELPPAQYVARWLEPENVSHSITTKDPPKRKMKMLFTRHRTLETMRITGHSKAQL